MTRILGIDPGSIVTGYGVIELSSNTESAVDYGCIQAKADDWPSRLKIIYDGIADVVERCQPDEVAIESAFVHRNAASALKLGQARAAALCAVFTVAGGVAEYAPRAVKLAVVGTGAATKDQVQHMIKALLKLNEAPQADAADALAIALCHSHGRRARSLLAAGKGSMVKGSMGSDSIDRRRKGSWRSWSGSIESDPIDRGSRRRRR